MSPSQPYFGGSNADMKTSHGPINEWRLTLFKPKAQSFWIRRPLPGLLSAWWGGPNIEYKGWQGLASDTCSFGIGFMNCSTTVSLFTKTTTRVSLRIETMLFQALLSFQEFLRSLDVWAPRARGQRISGPNHMKGLVLRGLLAMDPESLFGEAGS